MVGLYLYVTSEKFGEQYCSERFQIWRSWRIWVLFRMMAILARLTNRGTVQNVSGVAKLTRQTRVLVRMIATWQTGWRVVEHFPNPVPDCQTRKKVNKENWPIQESREKIGLSWEMILYILYRRNICIVCTMFRVALSSKVPKSKTMYKNGGGDINRKKIKRE